MLALCKHTNIKLSVKLNQRILNLILWITLSSHPISRCALGSLSTGRTVSIWLCCQCSFVLVLVGLLLVWVCLMCACNVICGSNNSFGLIIILPEHSSFFSCFACCRTAGERDYSSCSCHAKQTLPFGGSHRRQSCTCRMINISKLHWHAKCQLISRDEAAGSTWHLAGGTQALRRSGTLALWSADCVESWLATLPHTLSLA